MEERMSEIERVVISLSAGRLSKDILPPKQLSQTLHNIERQLPGNYSLVMLLKDPVRLGQYILLRYWIVQPSLSVLL